MSYYPSSVLRLIRHISRLPGIGEKTAERLALHLLQAPEEDVEQLARSIMDVKSKTRLCGMCYALSDEEICGICGDAGRDASLLCVVEQPADMVAIEKSGSYRGVYHVLSGVLSPMDGIGPEDIRIGPLFARIAEGKIKEVVIATGTNLEGEATASYIAEKLGSLEVNVTRIASGVPMGGDLKYVDQVTLKRAMETRHAV